MHWERWLPFAWVWLFWSVSVWNLDRLPRLHEDETWILSPGYKFFTQGIYGSDLFTGFYGMERHYLEFMPLMSLLQGAAARLLGVGVFQIRLLPLALGMLTLALTFRLAHDWWGGHAAHLSLLLLLLWQWHPGERGLSSTGIPLFDAARVGRYDILAALLGLCALSSFARARQTGRRGDDVLTGICIGLAGLAHIYGLLWFAALAGALMFDRWYTGHGSAPKSLTLMGVGIGLAWCGWVALALHHWSDLIGQMSYRPQYFDVLNPAFYWQNLRAEPHRYMLGWQTWDTWLRAGSWLLVVGLPVSTATLGICIVRRSPQGRRAGWLLAPVITLPLMFGLLIQPKPFHYLTSLVPVWVMAAAWSFAQGLKARRPGWRLATALCVGLLATQGVVRLAQVQFSARRVESLPAFYRALREAIPASRRILGPTEYWLALPEREYRAFVLPIWLSGTPGMTFEKAMDQVAPEVVLLDPRRIGDFSNYTSPNRVAWSEGFWHYFYQHRAQLIAEVISPWGEPVQVYQLDP